MQIKIPGVPIAKKRPRFARRGAYVTTYNAQETEEGKVLIQALEQIRAQTEAPLQGALSVSFVFRMPRPKSHFRTGKNAGEIKPGFDDCHHTGKPDLDNLIKFYLDVLAGHAFSDDRQIVNLSGIKVYSAEPGTLITITMFDC
jgi:Holliday junction resolvase RusA-like endonuclease